MIIELPQLAWYDGPKTLKINLPDEWDIEVCNIAGYNRPPLTSEQIKNAVCNPIGSRPLRETAKGKKEVAILFDDLTRATRPYLILPFILKELSEAGIPDHNIRFISALGAHAPLNRIDLVKKLGEDVVAKYQVYN
ncbi:MAG: lactate racemase domain-containing protein, partial [Chloroflexi bacterium]|nr:lactate racemase domain-containing protein [Chloroflexota bacterium]